MEGRLYKGPGRFKTEPNRVGSTTFVTPELLEGTLAKGFEIYRGLTSPLHRAIFMMFLISEVHPFADGNGRVARIMMNAELVAARENRIIVPTVYRNNYLMAFKALSQNGVTGALVRVIDFAQKYTAAVDFSDLIEPIWSLTELTHSPILMRPMPQAFVWCSRRLRSLQMCRKIESAVDGQVGVAHAVFAPMEFDS